jgi:DNA gyrase subunit B
MATNTEYDAAAIQTLEGLEAVRKRPGMYIGGTGSQGLVHLVWELIDNGVDEASGGFANKIEVVFHRDRSIEVIDNGRGIPVGKHPKHKVSALEVVLTELHAGGKFGGGAYGASGGLHGVGASVVNALSAKMAAEVDRDGYTWKLEFKDQKAGHFDGGRFKRGHELEKIKKISKTKTGSRIRFWPDWDIFDPDATIDYEIVRDRVARSTFLVPGLKIKLVDKRNGSKREDEFLSRGGLKDLVEFESSGDPVTKIITFSGIEKFEEKVPVDGKMTTVQRECTVDVAMRWVDGYDTSVSSFVNTVPTLMAAPT